MFDQNFGLSFCEICDQNSHFYIWTVLKLFERKVTTCISSDLISNLYKASADFFSLDTECKNRVKLTPQHPYGYEASEILSYTYNTEGEQVLFLEGLPN